MAMEFSQEYVTQAAFPHEFGLVAEDIQQQQFFQEFEQQQQQEQLAAGLQDPNSAIYAMNEENLPGQRVSCGDVKPRLTKEQHDVLEAHYQKQQKPNTSTKRGFAESLNVSLEKVNNWFQNRRAKSKQDAKKQQGTLGVFDLSQPGELGFSASDSETSPAYASADYQQMMQHFATDDDSSGTQVFEYQPQHVHAHYGPPHDVPRAYSTQLTNLTLLQAMANDLALHPQQEELNRRTLTQEQFDALNQQEMVLTSGDLAALSQDPEVLNKLLATYSAAANQNVHAQQEAISVPLQADPVITGPIATYPSLLGIPVARMEEQAVSASSSEWTGGSRSSSVSVPRSLETHEMATSLSSQQSLGQWQPGQSVPVDLHQLNEEFQKAAQARHDQPLETPLEQQMTWPVEGSHRRDSSASLVQSMGNVGLQTPVQTQSATFRSSTPSSSLAARRQRQRPAPLGLASLRSQSYSGTNPLHSPSHTPQQSLSGTPQLRRIKSSNIVTGISTGRVQKSIAMPQRSPLSWTFKDALTSPQAVRHQASQSASLAPPTPRSPPDQYGAEHVAQIPQAQKQQQQQWQSASGHVLQQDTISETDVEHAAAIVPASTSAPTCSSPPHTPMFHNHPQQFLPPQLIPGNVIMENTPPQSAPASQQCFSHSVFGPPPPQQTHYFQQPQHVLQGMAVQPHMQHQIMQQQPMQHVFVTQAQQQAAPAMVRPQFMGVMPPEQHMQIPPSSLPVAPQFTITSSGQPMEIPMHFGQHGVPIVDAQGQLQMAMPSQLQFVQHTSTKPEHQGHKAQPKFSPGGTQLVFASNPADHSPLQVTSQVPKHATSTSDFFVHEYTPPQDVKRTATPRKPVDTGPKNYTFTNQTPQNFEKASKRAAAKSSSSDSSPDPISS